ncbi:MAG: hypothetical protein IMF08_11160 [Proteobacteria bacterium]|nr:hypothetical protein [Pseudomonadota bacterium]
MNLLPSWVRVPSEGVKNAQLVADRRDEIAVFLSDLPRLEYSNLGHKVQFA